MLQEGFECRQTPRRTVAAYNGLGKTVSPARFISNDIAVLINNAPEPRAFPVHSIYGGKSITGQGTCTGLLTETYIRVVRLRKLREKQMHLAS